MRLTIQQMALISRLLDEALPLNEAARRRWLADLSPEYQDFAQVLRAALLTDATKSVEVQSFLETPPTLQALEQYNRTLLLQPDFFVTHGQLALLNTQIGQYPKAISEISKFRALIAARPDNEIAADDLALKKAFAAQAALGFWQEILRQRPRDATPFQGTQITLDSAILTWPSNP
jgi:tetratricopeptide (TPR) repeat protein